MCAAAVVRRVLQGGIWKSVVAEPVVCSIVGAWLLGTELKSFKMVFAQPLLVVGCTGHFALCT